MLWGRYDGMSFVCDALGSERGWGSDRLLGRAFRYLPAASCGEKASWVACRHVDLEMRISAPCSRGVLGVPTPPLSSRSLRRVTASATRTASDENGPRDLV